MRHLITGVTKDSAAARCGLMAGDVLLLMNGEPVADVIDYQSLSAQDTVTLTIERGGAEMTFQVDNEDWEPLGLQFDQSMTLTPRVCRNRCLFCFIDQMPPKLRSSLYVKDDDWRFSLMMGNYVTLTNVSDAEFARILYRHASPLYISVHATDPEIRSRLMRNPHAGEILPKLRQLKDAGIRFHCQIVCCPGINDGEVLTQTLEDLVSLAPAALSVAIVPVGLTKFRDDLPSLTPFDARMAKVLLRQLAPLQQHCRDTMGTSFAFASDEFYCLSGEAIPPADWYENYPQIENGVGLLRQFAQQLQEAAEEDQEADGGTTRTYLIATGVSAASYLRQFAQQYAPPNVTVHVQAIVNRFFGETVTVAGLLTGRDILAQLSPALLDAADQLLISANMLRHEQDLFLDDLTLDAFQKCLPLPVRVVGDGYDFYNALRNH